MSFIQQFAIALFIVSLLGILRTQGKQKAIASGLLALSLVLGFVGQTPGPDRSTTSLEPPVVGRQSQDGGSTGTSYQEISPIVIDHDGDYDLPAGPLKVCFTMTGEPAKDWYVDQQVIIGDIWQITERLSRCHDLPESVSGKKVSISLGSAGKRYTPEIKNKWNFGDDVNNDYEYLKKVGVSYYPRISPR